MIRTFAPLFLLGCVLMAGNAGAADGDLDSSFGIGGLARIQDGPEQRALAVQQDGRVLVCGSRGVLGIQGQSIAVTRFRANGELDPTFGDAGSSIIRIGQDRDTCAGIAVQADGRIVVAGTAIADGVFGGGSNDFSVARLDVDGQPDVTFGDGNGKTTVAFPGGSSSAAGIVMQPDGKIVIAGRARTGPRDYQMDYGLARLLPNGSPDMGFGAAGRVTVGFYDEFSYDIATSVALDREGRIIMSGSIGGGQAGLARVLADGTLDTHFAVDGRLIVTGAYISRVIVQQDQKLAAAGSSGNDAVVFRFLQQGEPDLEFGIQGIAHIAFDPASPETMRFLAWDAIEQSDHRLALAGAVRLADGDESQAAIARLESNGTLDSSFGVGGVARFSFGSGASGDEWFHAIGIQSGRILAAGASMDQDAAGTPYRTIVARLQNDLVFAQGFE